MDPSLGATIKSIGEKANVPDQLQDATLRTRVAYALQDVEKLAGPISSMQPGLREEMTRLAASYPGLRNERMQELVRGTVDLDDRSLVRDIRKRAADISRSSDQGSPDIQSQIEVMENRIRLSARASGTGAAVSGPEGKGLPQTATSHARSPVGENTTSRPETLVSSPGANLREEASRRAETPSQPGAVRATQEPGRQPAVQPVLPPEQVHQLKGGITLAIMQALRKPEPDTPAPWDNQLTPLRERFDRYNQTAQANRDEGSLRAAERSGQAALDALQTFANGSGASTMAKIREASKTDPQGMEGVVAGMREGGSYADLRRAFNADLLREKGLAASLDRAAAAVGRYGRDRTVADGIAAGRADATAITARFERFDAQIGKAASETPGRKEGKSQLEELGERAAELASKAVEALRAVFKRASPSSEQRAGTSPSMSPG